MIHQIQALSSTTAFVAFSNSIAGKRQQTFKSLQAKPLEADAMLAPRSAPPGDQLPRERHLQASHPSLHSFLTQRVAHLEIFERLATLPAKCHP